MLKPETKLIYAAIGRIEEEFLRFCFQLPNDDIVSEFVNECLDDPDLGGNMEVKEIISFLEDAAILAELTPYRNRIKCLKCKDIIESLHRHDFKWCKCKAVAVDGGGSYQRRLGYRQDYEEMP